MLYAGRFCGSSSRMKGVCMLSRGHEEKSTPSVRAFVVLLMLLGIPTSHTDAQQVERINGLDVEYEITLCEADGTSGCTELIVSIPPGPVPREYLLVGEDPNPITMSNGTASAVGQHINGDGNANNINALGGNDLLFGNGGDDGTFYPDQPLYNSPGLRGEVGNDIVYGNWGNDVLLGGVGDDLLFGGSHDDVLLGEEGVDYLFGEGGNDDLFGGAGNDVIRGGGGDDIIDAGPGDNQVHGGVGSDTLLLTDFAVGLTVDLALGQANDGNRSVSFSEIENLVATAFDDTLIGDGEDNVLVGEGGNDTVYGKAGNDLLEGGEGNDILKGNEGNDELHGGPGDDRLEGREDDDELRGDEGNDTLRGGDGDDVLYGGSGANTLKGDAGNDTLWGGGTDEYLYGGAGDDLLHATSGYNRLRGNEGNDRLSGGQDGDHMMGHEGDDELYGHRGDDALYGGLGLDLLHGGEGLDRLIGGDGADIFEFRLDDLDGNVDRVEDFSLSDGDRLDISLILMSYDIQQQGWVFSYDPATDDIADFVQIIPAGNRFEFHVDKDGLDTEYGFQHIAYIWSAPGLTVSNLLSGNGLLYLPRPIQY